MTASSVVQGRTCRCKSDEVRGGICVDPRTVGLGNSSLLSILVGVESPTRSYDSVMIDVGYPRDYDDDRLFEMTEKVSKLFLRMEERHGK